MKVQCTAKIDYNITIFVSEFVFSSVENFEYTNLANSNDRKWI